jgi:hypothetical protein
MAADAVAVAEGDGTSARKVDTVEAHNGGVGSEDCQTCSSPGRHGVASKRVCVWVGGVSAVGHRGVVGSSRVVGAGMAVCVAVLRVGDGGSAPGVCCVVNRGRGPRGEPAPGLLVIDGGVVSYW